MSGSAIERYVRRWSLNGTQYLFKRIWHDPSKANKNHNFRLESHINDRFKP